MTKQHEQQLAAVIKTLKEIHSSIEDDEEQEDAAEYITNAIDELENI